MKDEEKANDLGELIARSKKGDGLAFGKIYQEFFTPVFRYSFIRLKNKTEAEDITQTVFLKAFQSMGGFREQGRPFLSYLFTIARNTIIDQVRREKGKKIEDSEEIFRNLAGNEADPEKKMDLKRDTERVKKAMADLTEDQKETLTLRFMAELSYPEIAKILGKSEEAIRQLQCRALRALRKNLVKMKIF